LLKTAGQQIAVFLVQERAQEQLFETRQFEAFSKLTAFLMHDLKNVIAQQNLVVANAQRFRHRPEFIDDAIATISSSVERMRRILERLQGATRFEKPSRIQLLSLLREVCKECADRQPRPTVLGPDAEECFVEMDRDRLNMVATHLVRNAQDATPSDGYVKVSVSIDDAYARIEVADNGCGMDAEFVRDRLFKPFDSTKGAQGMGIGAYQIRETVTAAGGSVAVKSERGVGTTMIVKLPLAAARPVGGWARANERSASTAKVPDAASS
jgi:putative PEP-CTERM system histidine kinase